MPLRTAAAAVAAACALACALPALSATPPPKPAPQAKATPPPRIDITKIQPKGLAPKRALHVEYTVEVNRLGQVATVKTVKPSHDEWVDTHTYGNVLQIFIRTPDGHAISGLYRISYDYDPKTVRIRRGEPVLLHAGGVDPDAKGAAEAMMEIARRNAKKTMPPAPVTPNPAPSVRRMPDLPQVMKTATPAPH